MPALETIIAALGGLLVGIGVVSVLTMQRERRWLRQRVDAETRLRRDVVPVLERHADRLGIPPHERGPDAENTVELAVTLARAIRTHDESVELPFGDTLEVNRRELKISR